MVEVGQSGVLLPLSGCPKSAQVCFKSTPRGARKFQLTIGPWRARHGPNLVGIFRGFLQSFTFKSIMQSLPFRCLQQANALREREADVGHLVVRIDIASAFGQFLLQVVLLPCKL